MIWKYIGSHENLDMDANSWKLKSRAIIYTIEAGS